MKENKSMWLKQSKSAFSIKTKLKLALWLFVQKTFFKLSPHKFNVFRLWLINIFGGDVKKTCFIHSSAVIYMPWNLKMGDRSSIDFDVLIYNLDNVIIGDYVSISYKVNINTGSHDYTDPYFSLILKPVIINSGAFIGADTYIAPGVIIGLMTVIGARSTVTKTMPDNYVCFGHPCKPIKIRQMKNVEQR